MLRPTKNPALCLIHTRKTSLLAACLFTAAGAPGAAAQFTGFSPIEVLDIDPVFFQHVATGDFNNDGRVDVVMAATSANKIYILINNGNGAYDASSYPVNAPLDVVVADFNNDDKLDIAAISGFSTRFVHLFEGDGAGAFVEAAPVMTSNKARCMAVADYDGDDALDILVGDSDGALHMNFGHGDFQFAPPQTTPGSFQTVEMIPSDMNDDGIVDVVLLATQQGTSELRILQNNGAGVLLQANTVLMQNVSAHRLTVADANNDGRLDISLTLDYPFVEDSPGETWIFLAEGPNQLQPPIKLPPLSIPGLTGRANDVQFPDLDGDGRADMVISANYGPAFGPTTHRVHVYRGVATGAQQYVESYDAPTGIGDLRFFDQFGDYSPDLFALMSGSPASASNLTPMAPPAPFALLSPANGAQGLLTPGVGPFWPGVAALLDWSDSAAFHHTYDVHIKRLGEDEMVVHSAFALTESHYEVPEGVLQPGNRYEWTIRARNAVGAAAPSPIQIFEFTTAIPADLNGDGSVNGADLANLLSNWGVPAL